MSLQMCSEMNHSSSLKNKSMEAEHETETADVNKDESDDSDKSGSHLTETLQMEGHPTLKQQNSNDKKKRKRRKKKKCTNVTVIDSDKVVSSKQEKVPKEMNKMPEDMIVTEVGNIDHVKSLNKMGKCESTHGNTIVSKDELNTDFNTNCESYVNDHKVNCVHDFEECQCHHGNKANEINKNDKTVEKIKINEGNNFSLQCQIDLISDPIYKENCNIDATNKLHKIKEIGHQQEKLDSNKFINVTNQNLMLSISGQTITPDSLLICDGKDDESKEDKHNKHFVNITEEHDHINEADYQLNRNNLSNMNNLVNNVHNGELFTDIQNKSAEMVATEMSSEINMDVEFQTNFMDDAANCYINKSNADNTDNEVTKVPFGEEDKSTNVKTIVDGFFNNINNDITVNTDKILSVQSDRNINIAERMTCEQVGAVKFEKSNLEDERQNEADTKIDLNGGIILTSDNRSNVGDVPANLNCAVGSHVDVEAIGIGDISKKDPESEVKKKVCKITSIQLNDNSSQDNEISLQQLKSAAKHLQGSPGSIISETQMMTHPQEQQAAMTRLQVYIQTQKIEANLKQTSLRAKLRKKESEVKMIQAKYEQQMTSFLSRLLFIEGHLQREHKHMSDILQDKDDIIRRQKAAIADLTQKNDRLLKALKESHGYSEENGLVKPENIVFQQNGLIPIQDHGNKVILRAPKSKNGDKTASKVRFSAMKERLRRHKSSLELYHGDRLGTLDEAGLRYGSQENLVTQNGHSKDFDRKERCRSLVDYPYGLRDVCEHHNESPDSCFGDFPHNDSISLSTSSFIDIGEKSCTSTGKPLASYGFNELSKSRSVPHALPTVAENDSGNINLKERPLSLPSVELLAKDIQAVSTNSSNASLSGSKSSLPPPSPTNSSPPSESNPFKSIKNVFKRRGSKKKKSGITGNQESNSETLKQHFKKFNLS